jgi:hypothetical protein
MSDQVSAVRARVEAAALEYHKAEDGTGEGEYGCPGLSCPGVQRLANFWTPIVEAALRAVPLSAETEGLREAQDVLARCLSALESRRSTDALPVSEVRAALCEIQRALDAPTVAQAPKPPTIRGEGATPQVFKDGWSQGYEAGLRAQAEGTAPAVSREASVPQGGEWPTPFTVEQLRVYAALRLSLRCEQTNGQERDWSDTSIILARQLLALSEVT